MLGSLRGPLRESSAFQRTYENRHEKSGAWLSGYEGLNTVYLCGRTVRIPELGRIGSEVAKLTEPWNVRIIAYDPYMPKERVSSSMWASSKKTAYLINTARGPIVDEDALRRAQEGLACRSLGVYSK